MASKKHPDAELPDEFLDVVSHRAADLLRDDEEADDEDDEDEGEIDPLWTQEDLSYLTRDELKGLAEDWQVKFSAKSSIAALIQHILEAQRASLESPNEEE